MKRYTLTNGSVIECEEKRIGVGATAEVYLSLDKSTIVKIYKSKGKTTQDVLEQIIGKYNALRPLDNITRDYWQTRLAWPNGIISGEQLGITAPYISLPIKLTNLTSLSWRKANLTRETRGTWKAHLAICLKLAGAVRLCHLSGLCHSDLSPNNVLVDPKTGDIGMIDLDGLVVLDHITPLVVGTPKFQPPEIVMGKAGPSIQGDEHALAVMIYKTLMFHHPLEGKRIFKGLTAEEEDRNIFGSQPLYVQHPRDKRNRPEGWYMPVEKLGPHLPPLFERCFIEGLFNPEARPRADEWESALLKTLSRVITCSNNDCIGRCFVLTDDFPARCPFCGDTSQRGRMIPILRVYKSNHNNRGVFYRDDSDGGASLIVVNPGQKLYSWDINSGIKPDNAMDREPKVMFEFDASSDLWKILNLNCECLINVYDKGRNYIVRGSHAELNDGNWLIFGSYNTERVARIEFHKLN